MDVKIELEKLKYEGYRDETLAYLLLVIALFIVIMDYDKINVFGVCIILVLCLCLYFGIREGAMYLQSKNKLRNLYETHLKEHLKKEEETNKEKEKQEEAEEKKSEEEKEDKEERKEKRKARR